MNVYQVNVTTILHEKVINRNNQHLHPHNDDSCVKPIQDDFEDNPIDMTQNQNTQDHQVKFVQCLLRNVQTGVLQLLCYIQVDDIPHWHHLCPNHRHTPFPTHTKDDKLELFRNCHDLNLY